MQPTCVVCQPRRHILQRNRRRTRRILQRQRRRQIIRKLNRIHSAIIRRISNLNAHLRTIAVNTALRDGTFTVSASPGKISAAPPGKKIAPGLISARPCQPSRVIQNRQRRVLAIRLRTRIRSLHRPHHSRALRRPRHSAAPQRSPLFTTSATARPVPR